MRQDEEPSPFHPRFLSIAELREMYLRKEEPLNGDTLRAILEPLAGTSYLSHALKIFARLLPDPVLYAFDLYYLFDGTYDDENDLEQCPNEMQEDAAAALFHLAGFGVPRTNIYTSAWMEPDELFVEEERGDLLYHDSKRTQEPAGIHLINQFRFFKAGRERQTMLLSRLEFQNEAGIFHVYTQLGEGKYPHAFFSDWTQPGLAALQPAQQAFRSTNVSLYIGRQFSAQAALTKQET